MPSKEQDGSSIISLRLSDPLLDRLDCYLDWMETHWREKSSRNHAMRQALIQWLEAQEEHVGMTVPGRLRRRFQDACHSLRSGQDGVPIHRLRHLLNWPADRFDAVLDQFAFDVEITSVNGLPHEHGIDVVLLSETTTFFEFEDLSNSLVDWTMDTVPLESPDLYTTCVQVVLGAIPITVERCTFIQF